MRFAARNRQSEAKSAGVAVVSHKPVERPELGRNECTHDRSRMTR